MPPTQSVPHLGELSAFRVVDAFLLVLNYGLGFHEKDRKIANTMDNLEAHCQSFRPSTGEAPGQA
jgi:hypothetical protein